MKGLFLQFRRKYNFLIKDDWEWSFYSRKNNPKKLYNSNQLRNFNIPYKGHNKIFFYPKYKLNSGWYLFGIKHNGDANKIYGTFKSSYYLFSQSRLMLSNKWRWRIIRVKNKKNSVLILENICDDFKLDGLVLIPVNTFYAFYRIKKRLKPILGNKIINQLRPEILWKKYNNLLSNKINTEVLKYKEWLNNYEKITLDRFSKKNTHIKNKYLIVTTQNLKEVYPDCYVIPVKLNDRLPLWAVNIIDRSIQNFQDCDLFYGDEDCINKNGKRHSPHFKPAWNLELFLSDPSYSNSWIISSKLWNHSIKQLREKKQDINFKKLILIVVTNALFNNKFNPNIIHICFILYHKKKENSDLSFSRGANYHFSKYLYKHLSENKTHFGKIEKSTIIRNNIGYKFSWSTPKDSLLSVIIPTKNSLKILKNCLYSIKKFSPDCNFEIIVIDNGSTESDTIQFLDRFPEDFEIGQQRKVVKVPGPFNYSKIINKGALFASGDVLLLLNNDTEFRNKYWGKEFLSQALRPSVGCIGAKLLFPDNTIQHAGVILGIGGVAGHSHKYFHQNSFGYQSRLLLTQDFSAVTGACLAISAKNWQLLGGLDQENLHVNYNDVDLCLKALRFGLRNIYLPHVVLTHFESKSRGRPKREYYTQWEKESKFFKKKWKKILENDPSYSPHNTLIEENFLISIRNKNSIKIRDGFDEFLEL